MDCKFQLSGSPNSCPLSDEQMLSEPANRKASAVNEDEAGLGMLSPLAGTGDWVGASPPAAWHWAFPGVCLCQASITGESSRTY